MKLRRTPASSARTSESKVTTGILAIWACFSRRAMAFGLPAETAIASTPRVIMSCSIWASCASSYSFGATKMHLTPRSFAASAQPSWSGGVKALLSTLKTMPMVFSSADAAWDARTVAPSRSAVTVAFVFSCIDTSQGLRIVRSACSPRRAPSVVVRRGSEPLHSYGDDDEPADEGALPEGVHAGENKSIADDHDEQRPDRGAEGGAVSTGEAGAA